MTKPTFKLEEINRIKSNIKLALKQSFKDPDEIGSRLFREILFEGHPYEYDTLGTLEDIDKIGKEDLVNFLDNNLRINNLYVAASGDISESELKKYLKKYLKKFDKKNKTMFTIPVHKKRIEPKIFLHKKDLRQSSIIFAGEGVSRNDPYFYPAYVMNYILGGGGFFSKLTTEIREKRGLVYSIYASPESFSDSGTFQVVAGTGENEIKELLPVLCEELINSPKNLTEKEIEKSKAQLKTSTLMSIESTMTNATIAAYQLFRYGKLIDMQERIEKINNVTKTSIEKVANKLLSSKPTISSIGPIKQLESLDKIQNRLN